MKPTLLVIPLLLAAAGPPRQVAGSRFSAPPAADTLRYSVTIGGNRAGGLVVIPLWIPQLSFVVGAALLWLAVVDELQRVARGFKPRYVTVVEERHAAGDFSSDV